jgi:4-diphosphocytidyl-2-C-methyl-D-erythritol kinase
VSAFLAKRVPSGAGLGGGSSDAAFALMALNRIWQIGLSKDELARFAEQFGSDLSFFFHGPSSVCTGRGEIVRPIASPVGSSGTLWATLILPAIEMPTPAVYRRFDEMGLGSEEAVGDEIEIAARFASEASQWVRLPAKELMPLLVNDLEPAAFSIRPELGELRATLERSLSQVVRMSGSGSSLFTLCDDAEQAESLAKRVAEVAKVRAMAVAVAPLIALPIADASTSDQAAAGE